MSKLRTPCDACGCPIEFIDGPNGRPIPVQSVRTVYRLGDDGQLAKIALSPGHFYVSHFETCSDPGRFSRRKS